MSRKLCNSFSLNLTVNSAEWCVSKERAYSKEAHYKKKKKGYGLEWLTRGACISTGGRSNGDSLSKSRFESTGNPKGLLSAEFPRVKCWEMFQNGTYDKLQKCKEKEKKSPLIYEIFISMTHTKGADRSLLVTWRKLILCNCRPDGKRCTGGQHGEDTVITGWPNSDGLCRGGVCVVRHDEWDVKTTTNDY